MWILRVASAIGVAASAKTFAVPAVVALGLLLFAALYLYERGGARLTRRQGTSISSWTWGRPHDSDDAEGDRE